jgi:hypothetical protein
MLNVLLKSVLLLLIVFVPVFSNQLQQEPTQVIIKGRVVDNANKPVPQATIYLSTRSTKKTEIFIGTDDIIELFVANDSGEFCINNNFQPDTELVLYATTPVSNKYFMIIAPPFYSLYPNPYTGRTVLLTKEPQIQLNNVPLSVKYGRANIYFNNKDGKPFFSKQKDWIPMVLRIRDSDNKEIASTVFSSKSKYVENSIFFLALPEGCWQIEIFFVEGQKLAVKPIIKTLCFNSSQPTDYSIIVE